MLAAAWMIVVLLFLIWIELGALVNYFKSLPKIDHERRPFS